MLSRTSDLRYPNTTHARCHRKSNRRPGNRPPQDLGGPRADSRRHRQAHDQRPRRWTTTSSIEQDRNAVVAPLEHAGVRNSVDVIIRVHGGGSTGQAGACMQGIARALCVRQRPLRQAPREALPHPRRPHERTQEARPARRPPRHAVLQAVSNGLLTHRIVFGQAQPLVKPAACCLVAFQRFSRVFRHLFGGRAAAQRSRRRHRPPPRRPASPARRQPRLAGSPIRFHCDPAGCRGRPCGNTAVFFPR